MASITLYVPEQEPLELALDGYEQITIGRGPDNDVVLDHVSMSGSHAVIQNLEGTFQVNDLGSTNGTFVNGDQITEAVLSHGTRIMFGNVDAVFSDEASAAAGGDEANADAGVAAGAGYGANMAQLADVSNRPGGFDDLSPIEKVEKKDVVALVAMIVGIVAVLAAIALIGIAATMSA